WRCTEDVPPKDTLSVPDPVISMVTLATEPIVSVPAGGNVQTGVGVHVGGYHHVGVAVGVQVSGYHHVGVGVPVSGYRHVGVAVTVAMVVPDGGEDGPVLWLPACCDDDLNTLFMRARLPTVTS